MNILNKIIAYWLDCIKQEDLLAQNITIKDSRKAILCPFESDPFIFDDAQDKVSVSDEKIIELVNQAKIQNKELYYGYPIYIYYDKKREQHYAAPLFVVKVDFTKDDEQNIFLEKDNPIPNCGVEALSKMGLQVEQIAEINKEIAKLFREGNFDAKELIDKCLNVLREEINFSINEEIEPQNKIDKNKPIKARGLYNKSLIFSDDSTFFNMGLIKDLMILKKTKNVSKTSLSFITDEIKRDDAVGSNELRILPFPLNDYQISALEYALENRLSVVTGPPGTGKSQFIMNLLINLFLNDKKVLFVSHTNEAVDVVNEKINNDFQNLLFRTGNKEHRQGLIEKFNSLSLDVQKKADSLPPVSLQRINIIWRNINKNKKKLSEIYNIGGRVDEIYELRKLEGGIILSFKFWYYLWKLQSLPLKKDIEKRIVELKQIFFELSKEHIKFIYADKMLGEWSKSKKAKDFLEEVSKSKPSDEVDSVSFMEALDVIKIWSSTLKSLNRNFPLSANIFDYVVFDEASQIDLPSAAPALYRAKNAIIVGDSKQLSHVATITKELDEQIATRYNLQAHKELYPSKIKYYDVSLYDCAESCLDRPPFLLAKHYRSADQIIDLCNQVFYGKKLSIASNLDYSHWPDGLPLGVNWVDFCGAITKPSGGSRLNKQEALKVNEVFQRVIDKIGGANLSIGIVTPYARQQREIYDIITTTTPPDVLERHDVKILTAHKFQGDEKDIMIFSMVLSLHDKENSDRWYDANPQILNVALSRARYFLCIVGDKQFCLHRNGILKKISETYDEIKSQENLEEQYFSGHFDSPIEALLYQNLQKIDFESRGYKLIPKFIAKRYTLDFALVGEKKIDIECDGFKNHNIIDGLPVIEDVERDEYLTKEGWEVLRFPNHKIITKTKFVVEEILDKIKNNT